ncbi:hypothetical protein ABIA39_008999 [Nocardia sp. GAS34]
MPDTCYFGEYRMLAAGHIWIQGPDPEPRDPGFLL